MTTPNHIAGGIVFTGFFTSIYNINILEDWKTITVALFAMLLPDIDHTKSIIGKIFYPLARFLGRKYGHRTITHSLLFLFILTMLTYLIDLYLESNYTYIVGFGILSHLILDMVTVSGVPLFYPFKRNPCVLPANPDLRIRTGNIKQEGIALFIFALLALTLQDLFKEGFWTTYNKQFSSIEHVFREFQQHNKGLQLSYDYNIYDMNYSGNAQVLYAKSNELHLFNGTFFTLLEQPGLRLNSLNLNIMETERITKKIEFKGSLDSLNLFVLDKYILNASLLFSAEVSLNEKPRSLRFDFSNIFSPHFTTFSNDNERKLLHQEILAERRVIAFQLSKLSAMRKDLKHLEKSLSFLEDDPYQLDKAKRDIIALKKTIKNFSVDSSNLSALQSKYKLLIDKKVNASGRIWYFDNLIVN